MVQLPPRGDTTCRSASQMTQALGGSMLSGYCVLPAGRMEREMGSFRASVDLASTIAQMRGTAAGPPTTNPSGNVDLLRLTWRIRFSQSALRLLAGIGGDNVA